MIVNLWRFRAFILRGALGDIRYRYAGSMAGIAWNVVHPLALILIYWLVFSPIMGARLLDGRAGGSFALYLCAGLLPWAAFSDCVLRGASAFVDNATYLRKLPIPEQVFVAKNAVAATTFVALAMALLGTVTLVAEGTLPPTWLAVPGVLVLFQGFGFGIGLAFGTLNVFFRDVTQALTIGLHLWMWLTPIVYVESILPPHLRALLVYNPAFPFVDALHRATVGAEWPTVRQWALMVFWAGVAPAVGYAILRCLRPEIRDAL